MKKIFTFAFIALTLLATACGKSNNDNPNPTPQDDAKKALIGTWKIESSLSNGKEIKLTECSKKEYLVITQENFSTFIPEKCVLKEYKNKYTISDNTINLDNGMKSSFKIENNKLVIIVDEQNSTTYIKVE
jgi:lipoprotein